MVEIMKRKRERFIQVRVNDIEKEMAERLAAAQGRSLSSYVRWLVSLAVDQKTVLGDARNGN